MKKLALAVLSAVVAGAVAGCGAQGGASGEGIKIGTQTYTEPKIVAEMYKALIEDRTELTAEIVPDLAASPVVINAMKENEIQMASILYSGEIFNGYFDIEQTKDRARVMEQAQAGFEEHYGFTWFDGYGFENTYGFTVRRDVAEKYGLETVSDLGGVAGEMRLGVDTTWLERDNDGYAAFKEFYDYEFGKTFPMEISLVYEAVANDEVDVVLAYTTDPRLKEFDLKVLKDDKQFFPPYDGSAVVRNDALESHPELKEVVGLLEGKIDTETMTALNYEVDVNKRDAAEVAKEFLQENGLLQ
ncbi:glycine betaine ABC transporter substrate-binding protein [Paenibacillus sp.]|uniref:glycine betaine ABC transporter substrate-binding protein n=1 Tax=Paenibacillus sp. TaxID=58172 RepID=UPI002810FDE9|nr:glycine betaine ABC transporter substrate-binding protein [Paenibacillus sp.]